MFVLEIHPPFWPQGVWSGATAGGCRNNRTWINNPQFSAYLSEESTLVVILSQAGSENSMGFYILKTKGTETLFSSPQKKQITTGKTVQPFLQSVLPQLLPKRKSFLNLRSGKMKKVLAAIFSSFFL